MINYILADGLTYVLKESTVYAEQEEARIREYYNAFFTTHEIIIHKQFTLLKYPKLIKAQFDLYEEKI